jgi:actin-related protein 2
MKEKLCYVGYDIASEQRLAQETTFLVEQYTLPDGRVIKVGGERFEASEALFQPHLVPMQFIIQFFLAEKFSDNLSVTELETKFHKNIVDNYI